MLRKVLQEFKEDKPLNWLDGIKMTKVITGSLKIHGELLGDNKDLPTLDVDKNLYILMNSLLPQLLESLLMLNQLKDRKSVV